MASGEQRRRQWEKRIARWRAGGLSMAAYCREHELNYAQRVWWRRRLQRDAASPRLTLIPVVAVARSPLVIRLSGGARDESRIASEQGYPTPLRRIVIEDEAGDRITFLTNNTCLSPTTLAELYRCRWQVELFFKWIKS